MPHSDLSTAPRAGWRPSLRRGVAAVAFFGLASVMSPLFAADEFDADDSPVGWVARPALSSYDLRSGSEVIYRTNYKAGLWTGAVTANHINASGTVLQTSPWSADTAAQLTAMNPTARKIFTRNASGSPVPFRYASLSGTQQTALGGAKVAPQLVDFVRGGRADESPAGELFRPRVQVQGDIQHSTLTYWRYANGARRLYVGGNDGMLHAFDAATGQEVFAYVPSMLIPRLVRLTEDPYPGYLFVDGGLAIADVLSNSGSTRTLLAGALGGGGRGLFMLDVTNPSPTAEDVTNAQALAKWEVSHTTTGFANLGYTYAAPRLARLNNGVASVVVGNGYLNTGNGHATLFVINAETGALIREIDTGSGSLDSPNGLSTATLFDADLDGRPDLAYAGDIDGNVWRFDLTSPNPSSWTVSKLYTTSPAQAITSTPVVTRHPSAGQMVMVATGRLLTATDAEDTSVHYAYGLWDGAPANNAGLLEQTVTEVTSGTQRLRVLSSQTPTWTSGGQRGWRLALPAGERVLGEGAFTQDDRLYLVSTNPTVPPVSAGQAGGANWLMEIHHLSGGSPSAPVFDVNVDGKIDSADNVDGKVVAGKHLGAGVNSQAVLTDRSSTSVTLFNRQSDFDYSVPRVNNDPGVSGGHFDVDFYVVSSGKFVKIKHVHEYDDKYNVTGVNFLNPSDPLFKLTTKVAATTPFKVLLMNQYANPAAQLQVGSSDWVSVKSYGGLPTATKADDVLSALPTHTAAKIGNFAWKLPLDAFKTKNWWGDGTLRAGLMPTVTGCVNSINANGATPFLGEKDGRHNGALTLQLIKPETPASALEINGSGGDTKYGWRVRLADFTKYVLAEYTMFWHHPNGKCFGLPGWVPNPPEDFDSATGGTPPAGTGDPNDGTFGNPPANVTIRSVVTTVNGSTTTTTITYSDGKTLILEITDNGNGSETVKTTDRDGKVTTLVRMAAGSVSSAPAEVLQQSRRISWREAVRQ